MTVILNSEPAGLFNRLGKIGRFLKDTNVYQLGNFQTDLLAVAYGYTAEPDLSAPLTQSGDSSRISIGSFMSQLQSAALSTVNRMVWRDTGNSRDNIALNLAELIRQMKDASASVKVCTITMSASAITGTGNGWVVTSTKRGDGLVQENTFAEVGILKCIGDAQLGGATAGNETFRFQGDVAQGNTFHWEWPLGSGANTSLSATNATKDNSANNLLTNSGFETFTSTNTPSKWTIAAGAAGTEFFSSTTAYSGSKSLKIVGGTAVNASLTQTFNSSSGTAGKLKPLTQYAHSFAIKADVVPASGVLTIDLIDGSNAVINDDQGIANSYTVTLSAISTSWAKYTGVFRTPKVLPSTMKLRVRLSTVLPSGSNVFLDHMAMPEMTRLYLGGPYLSIFSGSTAFIKDDYWSIATTNDRGTATYQATFQTLFDRLFNMRQYELMLPSAASPTIGDTLMDPTPMMDFVFSSNSQYLPVA